VNYTFKKLLREKSMCNSILDPCISS